MPAETKQKTFTKGGNPLRTWGKGLADVLGVKVVNEQSQAPKQEFAAAPSVSPNAQALGNMDKTPVDMNTVRPLPPVDVPMTPTTPPEIPSARPENAFSQVPAVPAASEQSVISTPSVPAVAEPINTIIPNPTEVPSMTPTAPEISEPEMPQPPPAEITSDSVRSVAPPEEPEVVQAAKPEVVEAQAPIFEPEDKADIHSVQEPKIVDVKDDNAPTIVPPSMGAPAIVSKVPSPETSVSEENSVPDVFQSAFQKEPEDHLDPTTSSNAQPDSENMQKREFDVKINPIAEKLIKERPGEFISMDANGKPTFDAVKFDEQLFVKEVQEEPTFKNLLNQLGKRGVSMETTIDALKQLIEV